MDLRLMRYFLAVCDELHFTRAAARLGIHQAPLSQQIRKLENELGAQLFRRKSRGVELTSAGTALRGEAQAVLQRFDLAITTTRRVARGEQGQLRVGLTTSACFHPFPPSAIRKFRTLHPQVDIQFEQNSTRELLQRLQTGQLDVAFIRTVIVKPDGVQIVFLLSELMVAALPAEHTLAGSSDTHRLSLKSLSQEQFIGYPRAAGTGLYDAVIASCIANGFSPNIAHETPQIVSTLNLVASAMGVSVVPASMERLQLDGVAYRRLTGAHTPKGELNLAIRSHAGPASEAFLKIVRAAIRNQKKA